MAQSIFSHASQAQIHQCLSEIGKCLQPTGVLAATFVAGTVDYQGEGWIYPECATYSPKQAMRIAEAHNLIAETIDLAPPKRADVALDQTGCESILSRAMLLWTYLAIA